jgi:hypothetical protein
MPGSGIASLTLDWPSSVGTLPSHVCCTVLESLSGYAGLCVEAAELPPDATLAGSCIV